MSGHVSFWIVLLQTLFSGLFFIAVEINYSHSLVFSFRFADELNLVVLGVSAFLFCQLLFQDLFTLLAFVHVTFTFKAQRQQSNLTLF